MFVIEEDCGQNKKEDIVTPVRLKKREYITRAHRPRRRHQ